MTNESVLCHSEDTFLVDNTSPILSRHQYSYCEADFTDNSSLFLIY